jgi:hypothetical protein
MNDILTAPAPWYTNMALLVGAVAFVATVLGATIGAMSNYFIARRKQKDDLAIKRDERAFEGKRAARLIYADLLVAYTIVQMTIDEGVWNIALFENESWSKYSFILAPAVSSDDWVHLNTAQIAISHAVAMRRMAIDSKSTQTPLGDILNSLKSYLTAIDEAINRLKKFQSD